MLEIIAGLQNRHISQGVLDTYYNKFCKTLFNEMNNYLHCTYVNKKLEKYLKN